MDNLAKLNQKKLSTVWQYFTIVDSCFAKCNACNTKLSYRTTITNLKKHLAKKHPAIKLPPSKHNKKVRKVENEVFYDITLIQPPKNIQEDFVYEEKVDKDEIISLSLEDTDEINSLSFEESLAKDQKFSDIEFITEKEDIKYVNSVVESETDETKYLDQKQLERLALIESIYLTRIQRKYYAEKLKLIKT